MLWVEVCGGGKEPRSGAAMRLPGIVEITGRWRFETNHASGIMGNVDDGISRWHGVRSRQTLVWPRRHTMAGEKIGKGGRKPC